jgi:hypothetical protein
VSWAHYRLFIELFKANKHKLVNLSVQRLLTDPAAVRGAQLFSHL